MGKSIWQRRHAERLRRLNEKVGEAKANWMAERGIDTVPFKRCEGGGPAARTSSGSLRKGLYRVNVDVKAMLKQPEDYKAYMDLMYMENAFKGKHTTIHHGNFEGQVYYGFVEMSDALLLAWRFSDYSENLSSK